MGTRALRKILRNRRCRIHWLTPRGGTRPQEFWRARVRALQQHGLLWLAGSVAARNQRPARIIFGRHPRSQRGPDRYEGLRFSYASGGSDRDSLLLPLAGHLRRNQYPPGTLNVLQAARDWDILRTWFIHSTSEVYGTAQFSPDHRTAPAAGAVALLGQQKTRADQLALSFERSFGTPVTVVRPFNTYGPRQSARAVVPTIITQIAAGQRAVKLGSIHPTRDFNFVIDTVAGLSRRARDQGRYRRGH